MKIAEFLYTDKDNFKHSFKIALENNEANSIIFKTGIGTQISPQSIGLTNRKLFELLGKDFNPRKDFKSPMIELYNFMEAYKEKSVSSIKKAGNYFVAYDNEQKSMGRISITTGKFVGNTNALLLLNEHLDKFLKSQGKEGIFTN